MQNYQPNSHKFKEEQKTAEKKKVEKVVSGTAKIKKKSEIRKFADVFVSEDASSVKSFVLEDVVIPGVKKLIVNAIKVTAEMVFGESGSDRYGRDSKIPYVSYDRFSSSRSDRRDEPRSKQRFDFNNISFEHRADAELVLDQMDNMLREYGSVSVADMYEAAGLPAPPYTSNKYGWTHLGDARISRQGGDYVLVLPRPRPI